MKHKPIARPREWAFGVSMQTYTKVYYKSVLIGSEPSAREIIPIVLELIQPESIVDVGCGNGDWLSVFREFGIENILGMDGEWVDVRGLRIPVDSFRSVDLKAPFNVEEQFDLVISLEVAEHIPDESADTFIESLCRLGPVILFSAAIPHQGGTNHVNEQWQDYWARSFMTKGYVAIDCIRKRIWNNENVEWWYAQNIILYVKENYMESQPALKNEYRINKNNQLSIVHPKLYLDKVKRANPKHVIHVALAGAKDAMKKNVSHLLRRIGLSG
jgi:SAM-dependent methyltransferase